MINRERPALERHEVILDVAPDLPLVRMDYVLMEEALVNLLHNAAIHTPPGTRVRVTAKVDNNELVLIVADRGPGLPPEALPHVFDKFYRAPGAPAGGVGLGLSITRGLVEAQGGTIMARIAPMAARGSPYSYRWARLPRRRRRPHEPGRRDPRDRR